VGTIALLMTLIGMWPSCPAEGWVTSEYGYRTHPITGRRAFHSGIDVGNEEGTLVRSPWAGRVVKVRRSRDFGLYVVVSSGPLRLLMAHLSEAKVQEGQRLHKGAVVGLMGHTGRATGDHLHLEIRHRRKRVNPRFSLVSCTPRE
jgi:murein DD-endopeptidase MepM/ murein hydrolase activator NlpD